MDVGRRSLHAGPHAIDLTPTEFAMLACMLRAPGRVFSRGELLAAAGDGDGLERTVDSHVKNLRRKLGAAGFSEAVETVYGAGYRLTESRSHERATSSR
jgi:DNA-binding response OmpR family regulator